MTQLHPAVRQGRLVRATYVPIKFEKNHEMPHRGHVYGLPCHFGRWPAIFPSLREKGRCGGKSFGKLSFLLSYPKPSTARVEKPPPPSPEYFCSQSSRPDRLLPPWWHYRARLADQPYPKPPATPSIYPSHTSCYSTATVAPSCTHFQTSQSLYCFPSETSLSRLPLLQVIPEASPSSTTLVRSPRRHRLALST